MLELVYSLLNGVGFVAIAIALVLGSYFTARHLLVFDVDNDRTHDVAGAVAVRVAALHGLILALVYAQELADYQSIRAVLTEETVAISDIYNDVRRYGGPVVVSVQTDLADYLHAVVDEEWALLGSERKLSNKAWSEWEHVYASLLDLTPVSSRERFLSDRMLKRVTDIARFRQMREATALDGFTYIFWAPALIGLILVALPFFVYRPTRTNILLMSFFGAYSGVILFFIFAFANPFAAPGKLDPRPFEHLLEGEIGKHLDRPPAS